MGVYYNIKLMGWGEGKRGGGRQEMSISLGHDADTSIIAEISPPAAGSVRQLSG
jgi:hypothetical protein